jgi:glycosyltransferase involved in cell wall biosynthesis
LKLLYTNFHTGDGGGHTTYLRILATSFSQLFEVHVAAPPGSRLQREAALIPGVKVLEQPFPNGLNKLAARAAARRQLAAYLEAQRFDLVHVNGSADHRLVLAALPAQRPRIVLTKHNSKPMTGLGHWWRARQTDAVIAVSEYTRRQLEGTAYRRCLLATVPNGIDIEHFRPATDAATAEARAVWTGGHDDRLLLGSNAGTADYKGWMDLVEALGLLDPEERARVRVVVAGVAPKDAVRRRIADLGMAEAVVFPGLLSDVRPMVAGLDAGFVLSWGVETISFACREMMAMGKPVMVSDYAGLPENIRADEDGWIVPVRDRRAIADRVRELLRDRARLPAMGRAARAHAEAEFGLPQFVARTEAVYRDVLAARPTYS